MMVLKKINNNVAICRDGNQRELVAFGKGIGFPATPYELTDLSKIDRTFYNVNHQYLPLLNDIPEEIIQFTARQMLEVQDRLPYETNANLVLTLADHIAFAIERKKRGIYIRMPSIYEMALEYTEETEIGRQIVEAVRREFGVKLPQSEIQGIAMQFVNARNKTLLDEPDDIEEDFEEILEQITRIIEECLNIRVQRNTFNYVRFATHVQYLLRRIFDERYIDSDNSQMYETVRNEYPEAAACVDKISKYYRREWLVELTDEEKLYLIMHVNRVCSQETC